MYSAKLLRTTFLFFHFIDLSCNSNLCSLIWFLKEDGKNAIEEYIKWLKNLDPDYDWIGGNSSSLRFENNKIIVNSAFDRDEPDENKFSTSPQKMLAILEKWKKILEMKPRADEVIFYQYNEDIVIEPIIYAEHVMQEQRLLNFFDSYHSSYKLYKDLAIDKIDGIEGKSYFVKDEKNNFFMIATLGSREKIPHIRNNIDIDFKKFAEFQRLGNLSLVDDSELFEILGVRPDTVTPYALINNETKKINFFLDRRFFNYDTLNFYPLRNDMLISVKFNEFLLFFERIFYPAILVNIPEKPQFDF